jgi:hypothetical protein
LDGRQAWLHGKHACEGRLESTTQPQVMCQPLGWCLVVAERLFFHLGVLLCHTTQGYCFIHGLHSMAEKGFSHTMAKVD